MLGGNSVPKSIPESERYETICLALNCPNNGNDVVLERSIRGGHFKLISTGQAEKILSAKHRSGSSDSVSQYLLNLSGLTGKKVHTNQGGETREVSFRDLARLILVDEEKVISEISPILTGQHPQSTVEKAVFRLMLTGVDDSSLIPSENPKIAKGRQIGKVEMLDLLSNQVKREIAELKLPGNAQVWQDHLRQVELLHEAVQNELAVEQQNAALLEDKRRLELSDLRKIESRIGVLTELHDRFGLLEKQYQSDICRLESIAEAGSHLSEMQEERCRVCGAPVAYQEHEHRGDDTTFGDVAQSCLAEMVKIRALILDLQSTREDNDKEIASLRNQCALSKEHIRKISSELSELLKPRIQTALLKLRESQATRDTYRHAIELDGQVNELQKLKFEIEKKNLKNSVIELNGIRADEAENFCKETEDLLRSWHFPEMGRVTFSEKNQDIVISDRQRESHGKGIRAITHAAFNLALLKYCLKFNKPHPGFVLIDSPLVVYKEPDKNDVVFPHEVKDAFYRSIAEQFRLSQVIVFENEDPPSDLASNANLIKFTGASHGRKGFIPFNP
jgi:hypothetical protein